MKEEELSIQEKMERAIYNARLAEWEDYHRENPMVWQYFQKFTFEAIAKKRKKISHWLIINRIRWEVYMVTTGKEFKICNNFISFYARFWQKTYPAHQTLFNTKKMIGEP